MTALPLDQPDPARVALAKCYQLARERARIIRAAALAQSQPDNTPPAEAAPQAETQPEPSLDHQDN